MNKTGYPSIDRTHEKTNSFRQNHPFIPNLSIVNAISLMSVSYRKAFAIDCLDLRITYQELLDLSKIIARAFKALDIQKGDILVASMPSCFQAVAVYLAANRIGAVATFLNPGCSVEEVNYYLNEFESPLLIHFDKTQAYNETVRKATKVKHIITLKREHLNVKDFRMESEETIDLYGDISYHDLGLVAKTCQTRMNPLFSGG